ncbi:MAG: PQQ-binding-like beta-propeller repeat protein [Bryobacterales bacterium]|nr:PQQ-binding-like beta-propeller repeat protein [Bryobacterales bacterium]
MRTAPASGYRDWRVYGGGPESIRYSALRQIHRGNVHKLRVAWTYDTGDAFEGSEMQCNPIVVDGVLYATTPKLRVIALDAATGKLLWRFDPHGGAPVRTRFRNRGVTYANGRIYVAVRQWLYALDAKTGKPVPSFGRNGRIDLREGLGRDPYTLSVSATTPGIVYRDLLILGSIVPEDLPSAPGHIRAYDLKTGKLRWIFRTIPHPGEFGYETWPPEAWKYSGGANCWAGMSLDEKRGLVFAGTGSAAFDFYGGDRIGDNLFANTLLCLRADTGERVWHFQAVRHDVWDRDFPAPPSLVTVLRDGRLVDAVAQITKSGHVFVFERETGRPLFPIEYRKVPPSDIPGERLAETQPLPLRPPPFARQELTEDLLTDRTPEARAAVLERFRKLRSGGQFTPPSFEGTIIFPGLDGGAEWGGAAFDPETGWLYVNSNEMAWILRLAERPKLDSTASGKQLYRQHCASCHRMDLRGNPPEFPSLLNLDRKYDHDEILRWIREGGGRMPGFGHLGRGAVRAIAAYVVTGKDVAAEAAAGPRVPYMLADGYLKFLDPDGYPAVKPPWGTLNAIDLDTGEIVWSIPLGEIPELAAKGYRNTGSENYGGPVVTAGGLLFIGATNHDRKFRAFDKHTGELLWETTLPAAGNATPAVYEVNGRQFVVIAAGGGKWGLPSGGTYVAFALPEE